MRFEIAPEGAKTIILRSDAEPTKIGWYIAEDGIKGWFGTPEPREDPLSRHSANGDAWPPMITQGPRTFSIDVIARFDSTIECARGRDLVNGLAGKKIKVTGYDALGPRSVECYLSDDPDPELTPDEQNMLFTLTLTAPYPYKNGAERTYDANGGAVRVLNSGNCEAYPKLVLDGCTSASVTYDKHVVSYSGSATSRTLDLSQDLSGISGITSDDAFAVPTGWTTLQTSHSGGSMQLILADAWM